MVRSRAMDGKLPRAAYEPVKGEEYRPWVAEARPTEATLRAVVSGIFLGMIFGAANTYLGLKAGLTISTSIPVAVLTVVLFRALPGRGGILEANLSQTIGSASSSVASGVLFTLPALFIWGMPPAWRQMTLLAMAGGLIGVLAMIPLRRYLIRREHGKLPYPEGMACAEVLVAAEAGGRQASNVFWGIGVGMSFKVLTDGLKLVSGKFQATLPGKAVVSVAVSPALIGVGYILGLRIAAVMAAGGALSALVIIPLVNAWGAGLDAPFYPETAKLIRDMSAAELHNRYVRYIGAGAVATGGIITLVKSIPTMLESFRLGVGQLGAGPASGAVARTERDLSYRVVGIVVLFVLAILVLVPGVLGYIDRLPVRLLAALLISVFAFFFVTVSSRIVGLVGVTSNPTSGMTIATLLGTSAIFLALGWTDDAGKATALMVGTAVCIAASIAGDTSQDLKTGFVLGATPRVQQLGELAGVVTSAGVVCWVLQILHRTTEGGLGGPDLPAPQGTLMSLIIDGVLERKLPWFLIMIGVALALVVWAARLPVLPFAVGVYLPLATMAAVFVGGLLRWWITRDVGEEVAERRREQGVLFASGLVGGGGLTGVLLALWVFVAGSRIRGVPLDLPPVAASAVAAATIVAIAWILRRRAERVP